LACFHSNSKYNNQISSVDILDCVITANFEKELFKVDSINFVEGYAFYIRFVNDSSYLRINDIEGLAPFESFEEDSNYKEINRTIGKDIIDRRGKINTTNLFWREIKNEHVQIVYDYCPEEKLKLLNEIMDTVYNKLITAR
jgi:hypothetical protein